MRLVAAVAAEESCPEIGSRQPGPSMKQMHHDQRLHVSFASVH